MTKFVLQWNIMEDSAVLDQIESTNLKFRCLKIGKI